MEQHICEIHNKPLKRGTKGSWYCSTPIKKDKDGNVLEWCRTRYFEESEEIKVFKKKAQAPIGDQFIMDVLARIEEKLDKLLEN